MKALIVESTKGLGLLWQRHLERHAIEAHLAIDQQEAVAMLHAAPYDILILDLVLDGSSALAVADFAGYRRPEARVIFVTNTSFFSDGSIFSHCANACALVQSDAPPEDIAAMACYFGAT